MQNNHFMQIRRKKPRTDGVVEYPYQDKNNKYIVSLPKFRSGGRYKKNQIYLDTLEEVRVALEAGCRIRMAPKGSSHGSLIVSENILIEDIDQTYIPIEYDKNNTPEGIAKYRWHLYRERNKYLVNEKKSQALKLNRELRCEACGTTMTELYGAIGKDYIECHHILPLSQYGKAGGVTRLDDLALVCPNCHSMLHQGKGQPQPTIEILKSAFRLAKSLR